MTEFKVGDRVKVLESRSHGWSHREGEIIGEGGSSYDWRVEFKHGNGSIPGCLDASFWERELEKVEPKPGELFKPGDRVTCHADYSFEPCEGVVTGYTAYDKPSLTGRHGYYDVEIEGEDSGDGGWAYYEDELKPAGLVLEFREGDRVRLVRDLEGVEVEGMLPVSAHPDELAPAEEPFVLEGKGQVFVGPIGTAPLSDGWKPLGFLAEPDVLEESPQAAVDPDADRWQRDANRRLALELAVASAKGTGAGASNIVGRAHKFARFLNGEGA